MQAGRPTKYKAEYAKQAAKLCAMGATDEELADFLEVNRSSIQRWRVSHPAFNKAMLDGKAQADDRVVRALYSKALGYEYQEAVTTTDADGVVSEIKTHSKHQASDNTAMIFWLKNRLPEKWRDRREFEVGGDSVEPMTISFNVNDAKGEVKVTRGTDPK